MRVVVLYSTFVAVRGVLVLLRRLASVVTVANIIQATSVLTVRLRRSRSYEILYRA